jgi:hydrogenase maturation protease
VITVYVRFLQIVARRVGAFESPLHDWPDDEIPPHRDVESLRVGDDVVRSWQEAVEREVSLGAVTLSELVASPRRVEFSFGPGRQAEPLRGPSAAIVGLIWREQRRVDGGADLSAEAVGPGLYRVTVRIENRTHLDPAAVSDRDEALLHSLVSTHTILGVQRGEFLSSLDPPEDARSLAAGCSNVGTWPVLVGSSGETDTLLSSPITLYDYPQVAPESPGDLFDATEIDEILTLRIMTLTDEERRSIAALDGRGRELLERTESLAREQLMRLHGTLRQMLPSTEVEAGGTRHG